MAKLLRSSLGSFISANGERLSKQVKIRVSDHIFDRLASLLPDSVDRHDFIRSAIAEKLDRDQHLSLIMSGRSACLRQKNSGVLFSRTQRAHPQDEPLQADG